MKNVIIIHAETCMWSPGVVSWLSEEGCVKVKHIDQHICYGAMCDIVANSHINVMKCGFSVIIT